MCLNNDVTQWFLQSGTEPVIGVICDGMETGSVRSHGWLIIHHPAIVCDRVRSYENQAQLVVENLGRGKT